MRVQISGLPETATVASAASNQQRQYPAEPLWFAVMCRSIWGPNAPKDLEFQLGKPDRTCRAWSSGSYDPAATILAALLRGDDGKQILEFVMRDSTAQWWREHERARSVGEQVLEITKLE